MALGEKLRSSRIDPPKKKAAMTIRFWGVRGGIASPSDETIRFGGNTACVEIRAGEHTFVLDCGTGARELGRELMAHAPVRLHLLFSDYRWDHLQGFPFFTPVYIPTSEIHIHGPRHGAHGVEEMLADQMKFPVFPIQMEHLNARFTFDTLGRGSSFEVGGGAVKVSTYGPVKDSLAYRIEEAGGRSFVYLPDVLNGSEDPALVEFCRKASAVVMNATVPGSLNGARAKATRSLWDFSVRLTRQARAKRLVLFHHAPDEDDRTLSGLERRARREFPATLAAYEGLKLAL